MKKKGMALDYADVKNLLGGSNCLEIMKEHFPVSTR